ncbi:hypothetical protein CWI85_12525, partial [Streptomyces albidoflavus]
MPQRDDQRALHQVHADHGDGAVGVGVVEPVPLLGERALVQAAHAGGGGVHGVGEDGQVRRHRDSPASVASASWRRRLPTPKTPCS